MLKEKKQIKFFNFPKSKNKKRYIYNFGKGGIRTPGDREATLVFKTRAFNHSATFP